MMLPLGNMPRLLAACVLASTAPNEAAEALPQLMGPGASFENLWLSLGNQPWEKERRGLRAARATTGDPAHVLQISELCFSIENLEQPFELTAPSAVYDTRRGELWVASGFHGSVWGFDCRGLALSGSTEHLQFQASGTLELSAPGQPAPANSGFNRAAPPFSWSPPPRHVSMPLMKSPIRLMQEFSGNLVDFSRCLDRVFPTIPDAVWQPRPSILMTSLAGGSFDLRQGVVELTGPAAVLGPSMVLFSHGGIRVAREELDGTMLIRATGGGGLQGWLPSASSGQSWIACESFEWVNQGSVIQFTGGPVEVTRDGTVLKATESWQYVRLFGSKRVVLSPGSWTTETDATADPGEP